MNAFGYTQENLIGIKLGKLMEVDPGLASLTVAPEDLLGLDIGAGGFFGTLVSRVLARNTPKQAMSIGDMSIYENAETEV